MLLAYNAQEKNLQHYTLTSRVKDKKYQWILEVENQKKLVLKTALGYQINHSWTAFLGGNTDYQYGWGIEHAMGSWSIQLQNSFQNALGFQSQLTVQKQW